MAFAKAGDDKLNLNFGDAFKLVKPDYSKLLDLSTAKFPLSLSFELCRHQIFLVPYMEALKICASNGSFMEAFLA